MIQLYKNVAADTGTPAQVNNKILRSLILYLTEYQDTSNSKVKRYSGLDSAVTILEYLTVDLNINLPENEQNLLFSGFIKILTKAKEASINRFTVYVFKDEIGFLKLLVTE